MTTRSVTLHVPQACKVGDAAYAQFYELGDFEPSPPTAGHLLSHLGETIPEITSAARALLVEATRSSRTWSGVAAVPPSGDVDLLVLPALESCAISGSVSTRTGSTLAAYSAERALVVGGSPNPPTFVANLGTGVIEPVGVEPRVPRTSAAVTAFGDGALLSGGFRGDGTVEATAERYVEATGFDQQRPILLSEPRADQGAVVLASGQTLLVGGVGADGRSVLGSMEIVDPATGTVREQSVAPLAVPRRAPTVLRLASGEILVAGGLDSSGAAVPTIEWFSADGSHRTRTPQDLVPGAARAYVALDAGGALAVVAPPPGAPPGFQSVWVIGADGALDAAAPIGGPLTQPVLFRGGGGAPVLWTGDGRWLRWQPWQGAFGALGLLDPSAPAPASATTSAEPGFALWLDRQAQPVLHALRFDTRGEYSTLEGPLLGTTASDVSPDRLAQQGVASFDALVGLELGPGASAFVTDRTYANLAVDVDAPTGEPAFVVLRDDLGVELEVGGVTCPGALAKAGAPSSLHVERAAGTVNWTIAGGAHGTCRTGVRSGARLSVGVRAPGGVTRSVARNLRVVRTGG